MVKSLAVLGVIVLVFIFIAGMYYLWTSIGLKNNAKIGGDTTDHDDDTKE